jgi:hypothetical protein
LDATLWMHVFKGNRISRTFDIWALVFDAYFAEEETFRPTSPIEQMRLPWPFSFSPW